MTLDTLKAIIIDLLDYELGYSNLKVESLQELSECSYESINSIDRLANLYRYTDYMVNFVILEENSRLLVKATDTADNDNFGILYFVITV